MLSHCFISHREVALKECYCIALSHRKNAIKTKGGEGTKRTRESALHLHVSEMLNFERSAEHYLVPQIVSILLQGCFVCIVTGGFNVALVVGSLDLGLDLRDLAVVVQAHTDDGDVMAGERCELRAYERERERNMQRSLAQKGDMQWEAPKVRGHRTEKESVKDVRAAGTRESEAFKEKAGIYPAGTSGRLAWISISLSAMRRSTWPYSLPSSGSICQCVPCQELEAK